MDFDISQEHRMVREAIREFSEREIAPLAAEAAPTPEIQPPVRAKALGL